MVYRKVYYLLLHKDRFRTKYRSKSVFPMEMGSLCS